MKSVVALITLLACFALAPACAEDAFRSPLIGARDEEDSAQSPAWRLYHDAADVRMACFSLLACGQMHGLEELPALARRHCEDGFAACRAHRADCPYGEDEGALRELTDEALADIGSMLRGEQQWRGQERHRAQDVAALMECLPRDAEGEPWLSVPKAQQRLRSARQALFTALAEAEARLATDGSPDTLARTLDELLPLHAAFRRELLHWAPRALSDERLHRWREEEHTSPGSRNIRPQEYRAWLTYLREDAEEAAAQYDKNWRRACRHAAVDIRAGLADEPGVRLPTEPRWLAGEAMGQGVEKRQSPSFAEPSGEAATAQEEDLRLKSAFWYRRRDAHAFAALSDPPAGIPAKDRVLAATALRGEGLVLDEQAKRLGLQELSQPSWQQPWRQTEEEYLEDIRTRAGIPAAELRPVGSSDTDDLNTRVEAEAARLRQALDAAEAQLPRLPETPDAACRRLLGQLAARWNAYTEALRYWGYRDSQRSFWWYGGCCGYSPDSIWGEGYYLAGISTYRKEGGELVLIDQGNPRTLLAALISQMRGQLAASLHEHHHHPKGNTVTVYPPSITTPPQLQDAAFETPPTGKDGNWHMEMPLPDSFPAPETAPDNDGVSP